MDIDLRIRGAARSRVDAVGRVNIKHADINIPGGLPADVAVLDVRRPGEKRAPPPEEPALVVGLEVQVDAPRAVFTAAAASMQKWAARFTSPGRPPHPKLPAASP